MAFGGALRSPLAPASGKKRETRAHFFALDLILIALAGSLTKLTSDSGVRIPILPPELPPSERLCRPLTVALRF